MIAIISDIHGNYPALKAVLYDIDAQGCSQILCLGDVAGYYCMVNECVEVLAKRGVVNILGNHDAYLLGRGECPRSMTANRCIAYQKEIATEQTLRYLESSVAGYDCPVFSARHGGWKDPLDQYIRRFDPADGGTYPADCKIFFSGHSHIQSLQAGPPGHWQYANPGSVGQPRDGIPTAAYAILTDECEIRLRRVAYPIDEIAEAMKNASFDKRYYECLYRGKKIATYQP